MLDYGAFCQKPKAVAKAYGIPHNGAIALGYNADLVLVDLNNYRSVRREELLTKFRWSPFEGWKLTGWSAIIIVGGQIVDKKRTSAAYKAPTAL